MANISYEKINVIIPIITFIFGFLASRFTMSKKERKDHIASLQDRSNILSQRRNESFQRFTIALRSFAGKENPTLDDFTTIAITGTQYFNSMQIICDSILSGTIDQISVINSHVPGLKRTVEDLLPRFFETLQIISKRLNIPYQGELRREDFESIYAVYEKHCLKD